jgi:DNA-binding cell septation regulator SpoVG
MMQVKFLRKTDSGNLKAFFELHTPKMIIRDCKLMEGRDGNLFATMPSRKYTDKKDNQEKWVDIVRITDEALKTKITELARQEYFRGATQQQSDDIPF